MNFLSKIIVSGLLLVMPLLSTSVCYADSGTGLPQGYVYLKLPTSWKLQSYAAEGISKSECWRYYSPFEVTINGMKLLYCQYTAGNPTDSFSFSTDLKIAAKINHQLMCEIKATVKCQVFTADICSASMGCTEETGVECTATSISLASSSTCPKNANVLVGPGQGPWALSGVQIGFIPPPSIPAH